MPYYHSGDLIHYISNHFYNISWETKLFNLSSIISGLNDIHNAGIIHRDLHSGNIFFNFCCAYIGDLGISKSATESTDNNEIYGIIPYIAPEILQGKKYTKASDIYSFGMIMWEFMTSRRPFWDEIHDIELIIKICDGLRPPIVTNAPKGYIELMEECWHSDPRKRSATTELRIKIYIGPVTTNNSLAIYKSRPLSKMIHSAMSLGSRSTNLETDPFYHYQENIISPIGIYLIKFCLTLFELLLLIIFIIKIKEGRSKKKKKLFENENSDYSTKEVELDINANLTEPQNYEYITKEFEIDINNIIDVELHL
ncbi:kinase-like domain-containing protein [Rhizophagus diaphanus]|nr:kinase-like domain-containing protein [Rhizophagus diaphanus] [Rhizophagus sp. MUCL 43196]